MGRLRTNSNAPQLIKQFPNFVNLDQFRSRRTKLILEIGSGKGDFLIQQAINNPKTTFLGIEKYPTVVLKALKKVERRGSKLNNLFFSCQDFRLIDTKKFKNKFSKIYLNFSDPWPKKRHTKRRLTSDDFLSIYKKILTKNGVVEFKTDNSDFYHYTLQNILSKTKTIKIIYFTDNLYKNLANKFNIRNIQTEYEKKFVSQGKNIKKIIFKYYL